MFLKNSKINRYLEISFPGKRQEIFIGEGSASWIIEKLASSGYSGFVVFCDYNIANLYKNLLLEIRSKLKPADIILVKPTEANKSIEFLNLCLERCIKANLNRNGCLIAIGGGIVGDVVGFLASVYMRGIDMVFMPTTLMAQGDTIINKVAISYKLLKNVVGSFYSPRIIVCDTDFLQSLPEKEISLGFSEIIKHALIYSQTFTKSLSSILSSSMSGWKTYDWNYIVYESLKIKNKLVEKDPHDKLGIHKGLSYGHTFANALEGLSDFNFRHGDAVGLGMRISGEVSHSLGFLKKKDLALQNSLINATGLPLKFPHSINPDQVIGYLKKDKISTNEQINLVVLEKIGKHKVVKNVDEKLVRETLGTFLS